MIIKGKFVTKSDNDEKKQYLQIETGTGVLAEYPREEFLKLYNEGRRQIKSVRQTGVGLGNAVDIDMPISVASSADFTETINFVKAELERVLGSQMRDFVQEQKLVIQAEEENILELPWELAVDSGTLVCREVIGDEKDMVLAGRKNLLLLASMSFQPNSSNINGYVNLEVKNILNQVIENNKGNRIDNLFFLKNTTRDNFLSLNWKDFDFVHLVMHGEEDGRLCLESSTNYEDKDHLDKDTFLDIFSTKEIKGVSLVFLSMCFSAGGGTANNSLSFDLVKNGISKNVIGFSGGVDNKLAQEFSSRFYSLYYSGMSIENAFKGASTHCRINSEKISPYFYTRCVES